MLLVRYKQTRVQLWLSHMVENVELAEFMRAPVGVALFSGRVVSCITSAKTISESE